MNDLIKATEAAVVELDLAYTVIGEIMAYFSRTDEIGRNSIPYYADSIQNLLIIVNDFVLDNKNSLQKAVDMYYLEKGKKSNI